MHLKSAYFAGSGRSVQVADAACPVEFSLTWLYCALAQAYVDEWHRKLSAKGYSPQQLRSDFGTTMLRPLLGRPGNPQDLAAMADQIGKTPVFLELARDLEAGVRHTICLDWTQPSYSARMCFHLRAVKAGLELPGYQRALAFLAALCDVMDREVLSTRLHAEAQSFLRRVESMRPQLVAAGTPGSAYALALLDFLGTWKFQADRGLVFCP